MSTQQFVDDELFNAIKRNEPLSAIQDLVINCDANVNARDEYGCTPLMRAAYRGDMDIIVFLLFKGADPTATNKVNWTALMGAAFAGHLEATMCIYDASPNMVFKKDLAGLEAIDKARHNSKSPTDNYGKIVSFLDAMKKLLRNE